MQNGALVTSILEERGRVVVQSRQIGDNLHTQLIIILTFSSTNWLLTKSDTWLYALFVSFICWKKHTFNIFHFWNKLLKPLLIRNSYNIQLHTSSIRLNTVPKKPHFGLVATCFPALIKDCLTALSLPMDSSAKG